ncbi:MAG: thioesterase family protein [Rhodospirillales bacterium]|nr:thioesterase family protein [Alphaproteobacteria bacterium]MBL6947315.1 thioesterase family protein [Rhodospirillales bacterium]
MKPTLVPGLTYTHRFTVTEAKTVPGLYPESPDFVAMPKVFATGFMVGFIEWACLELLKPHLDEGEGSLGVHIDVDHRAATPPGMEVMADVEVTEVDGRRIAFSVTARDEVDVIAEGSHRRFIVEWDRFNAGLAEKTGR